MSEPSPMTAAEAQVRLRGLLAQYRALLAGADLRAPVPACPGWDLRALTWHLGGLHRWVVEAVEENRPGELVESGPTEPGDLLTWFDDGARHLLECLAGTDPEAAAWHFGPPPRTAAFWSRRQVHEHLVHLADAREALGLTGTIGPDLAADGIAEVRTVFFPRQVRRGRLAPLTTSVLVRCTDVSATDVPGAEVVLAGDGTADLPAGTEPDAVVEGPAEALFLLLWRRIGPDDLRITLTGDVAGARAVLAQPLVP